MCSSPHAVIGWWQGERDDAIARALASAAVSDSLAGIPRILLPSYPSSPLLVPCLADL